MACDNKGECVDWSKYEEVALTYMHWLMRIGDAQECPEKEVAFRKFACTTKCCCTNMQDFKQEVLVV